MKRCPTCNQTFEEAWLSFCTQDGTTLIDDAFQESELLPTIAPPPIADVAASIHEATWNFPSVDPIPSRQPQAVTPAWQPPPPPTYVQPPNKSLATAAMVVGLLSVFCLGPVPGIFAIVLGGMSLSQMKKEPQRVGGRQMALTGIVTGSLSLVIYGVLIAFYIMITIAANT